MDQLRAACTKGGGGSDTSSQSADEVHGDTKGRTEGGSCEGCGGRRPQSFESVLRAAGVRPV